jgi:hypothetical protein
MFRIGTPRGNNVSRPRRSDACEALQVQAGRRTQARQDHRICRLYRGHVSSRFKMYGEGAKPEMLRVLLAIEKQAHWKEYEN